MKSHVFGEAGDGIPCGRRLRYGGFGAASFRPRSKCYHLLMIDWSSCLDVERDPDRMSGAWVFRGTRVPVAALFENLEEDASLHQFIEWFPGVTLSQARNVLEHAAKSTLRAA